MYDNFNISIDYYKTINQANDLEKISYKCNDISNDIAREIEYIKNNWKGKTADALCEKLSELQRKNRNVSNDLNQVAGTMKQVANDIRQADIETSKSIKQMV